MHLVIDNIQEFFNKTVRHLAQQGGPCRTPEHRSAYNYEGRADVIGCHIGEVPQDLQSRRVKALITSGELTLDCVKSDPEIVLLLLEDLQLAHDCHYGLEGIKEKLREIAHEYGLNDSAVREITTWS